MLDLNDLNPQQRQAVTTTHGPVLLLAGAGSGKTRVIISRIAYLLEHLQVPPKQILAVTFTNKAANEMQERLRQIVKGAGSVHLSTFHSLCVTILRQYIQHLGYRPNFTIYDAHDQLSLIKGIIEDHGYGDTGLIDAKGAHFEIGQAKTWGKMPQDFLRLQHSPRDLVLGKIFEEYQRILQGCNAVDFDDILILALRLFEEHAVKIEELYHRYRFVMVDEYQDTNRSQYRLLRHLTRHYRNLCVVGDDDQSIYGWRGADIQNILSFEKDYPEAKVIRLEQNYRSTQTILNAANQVIAHNTERMSKKLWSQQGEGKKIGWVVGEDEVQEMNKVVEQIRLGVLRENRSYRDYAILYRSNFQSRVVEEALREGGVPYYVVGGTSFYERKEVKDAIAYLRVIYNPQDEVNLHRIINFPKRGIGKTSLIHANEVCKRLRCPLFEVVRQAPQYSEIASEAAHSMERFGNLISHYQQRFEHERMDLVFPELLEDIGFVRELEKDQHSDAKAREKRIACVLELIQSVRYYMAQNAERGLKEYLERVMLFSQAEDTPEEGKNMVTLMTLHSAKGLEYPYVFMIGMAEGVFPNKRSMEDEGEAEERRLCYVGITRAKKELTFSMAKMRKRYAEEIPQEPSRFLKEIDPQLFTISLDGKVNPAQREQQREEARAQFFAQIKQFKNKTASDSH